MDLDGRACLRGVNKELYRPPLYTRAPPAPAPSGRSAEGSLLRAPAEAQPCADCDCTRAISARSFDSSQTIPARSLCKSLKCVSWSVRARDARGVGGVVGGERVGRRSVEEGRRASSRRGTAAGARRGRAGQCGACRCGIGATCRAPSPRSRRESNEAFALSRLRCKLLRRASVRESERRSMR